MSCSEGICRHPNLIEGKVEAMGGRPKKVRREEQEAKMVGMGGRKGVGEEREVGGVKLRRRSC